MHLTHVSPLKTHARDQQTQIFFSHHALNVNVVHKHLDDGYYRSPGVGHHHYEVGEALEQFQGEERHPNPRRENPHHEG
jgi:hypothetical protein